MYQTTTQSCCLGNLEKLGTKSKILEKIRKDKLEEMRERLMDKCTAAVNLENKSFKSEKEKSIVKTRTRWTKLSVERWARGWEIYCSISHRAKSYFLFGPIFHLLSTSKNCHLSFNFIVKPCPMNWAILIGLCLVIRAVGHLLNSREGTSSQYQNNYFDLAVCKAYIWWWSYESLYLYSIILCICVAASM